MDFISKKEARNKGLKFYFTGKACRRGHITLRYVKGGSCVDCLSVIRNRWKKENAKRNKERNRLYKEELKENDPIKYILYNVKSRANKCNIPFSLSNEFIESLEVPENCPCCGIKMEFGSPKWSSPSMDRIINKFGYIDYNIVIVCFGCNRNKLDYGKEWFGFWYNLIIEAESKIKND